MNEMVEIHLRLLDCQICGGEINPDREEYLGRKRVCRRCYDSLTCGPDRRSRKNGYTKKRYRGVKMPIEIKVFNKRSAGEAPAVKYAARLLNEKGFGLAQDSNPCRSAQIIEGIHSGQIVPYDSYVITGELPAQADVMLQNTKMIEALAEAGRTINAHVRTIGSLRQQLEAGKGNDNLAALHDDVQRAVKEWWVSAESTSDSLIDSIFKYIRQREDGKQPF